MEEGITRIAKQWLGTFCIVYFFHFYLKNPATLNFPMLFILVIMIPTSISKFVLWHKVHGVKCYLLYFIKNHKTKSQWTGKRRLVSPK